MLSPKPTKGGEGYLIRDGASGCKLSLKKCLLKLITFELPLKQPWLEQSDTNQEELAQLKPNLKDHSQQLAKRLMNGLMRLSTVRLCKQLDLVHCGEAGRVCHPRNALEFSISGQGASESQPRTLLSGVAFVAAICLVAYSSVSIYTAAYLILQQDIMLTHMQPLVRSANMSAFTQNGVHCAIRGQIDYGPRFDEGLFLKINEWLDSLGQPIRSQLGVSFLALAIIGSSPFIFYCLPTIFTLLRGKELRLDSLASLYEPRQELRRLMGEQRYILNEMLHSFEMSRREHDYFLRRCRGFKNYDCLRQRSIRNPRSQEYIDLVEELVREPNLVRPLVANSEWLMMKQKCLPFIIMLFLAISFGAPLGAALFANILELQVRVKERLRALECSRWHPQGVILRPTFLLTPISAEDMLLYELYDGSLSNLISLMLRVELNYIGNYLFIFRFVLTLLPVVFFLSIWSTFWTSIYVLGFLDKISWLVQIKRQLECCCAASRTFMAKSRDKWAPGENQERRKRLLRPLVCVLVNWQLYRRQYKPFRILINFLLFQAAVFTSMATIVFYLIVTNIETQFKVFMFFTSGCVILFFNIYLVLASYTSKLVENIQSELIRLLAVLARDSQVNVMPALDMWRRQLLDEAEIQLFASTRVLGFAVCYKKIIAFNVHIVGVWLIMWRAIGSN